MSQATASEQTGLGATDVQSDFAAAPATGASQLSSASKEPSEQRPEAVQAVGHNAAMTQSALEPTHTSPIQVEAPLVDSSELNITQQGVGSKIALTSLFDDETPSATTVPPTIPSTHNSPTQVEAPLAGFSELSSQYIAQSESQKASPVRFLENGKLCTPESIASTFHESLQDKIREICDHLQLSANVYEDERAILTAEFTKSAPRPAGENRVKPASVEHPKTITVQLPVYTAAEITADTEPFALEDDQWRLTNLVLPADLQPLHWKTSVESDKTWTFLDELVHVPDPVKYSLQNQAFRMFHDQRRQALLQDYQKVAANDRGTHLALFAEFGLYAFEVGRPMRIFTVGGHGSVEHGWDKDARSPLGGCMYTYEEADVLCLTEAEHAIWAAHPNKPHIVLIIDPEFNRRRPAQSTKEFFDQCQILADVTDISVDVQMLELNAGISAGVNMTLKDALKAREKMKKNQPVSIENPPRNFLNISDQTPGHLVEGLTKSYRLMNQVTTMIDTKIYGALDDLKGKFAIGKPQTVVKHHSDMLKCGQFRIYADHGAVSLWHQDQCGVVTWTLLEGNTNDPNEHDEDVVKYWPSFDVKHLTEDERQKYLKQYATHGADWRPRPAGGIPVISILRGQKLIQTPGNIHAPITLTDCGFIGGMAWKAEDVKHHIKAFRFTAENGHCTNEDVPRQAQEYVSILNKMVHNNRERYGYAADDDLKEFDEDCDVIYSKVSNCTCFGSCEKNAKCACKIMNVKCGSDCHSQKVFEREKQCSKWASKPVESELVQKPPAFFEGVEVVQAPKKRPLVNRGEKRRHDESDEDEQAYQPDAKRQRRAASEVPLQQVPTKKMSEREKARAGKPCTNCGNSGIQTYYGGPDGATFCSACNKKWVRDGKPGVWPKNKVLKDSNSASQALSSALEAPKSTAPAGFAPSKRLKRKILSDDDESDAEIPAQNKRQRTTGAQDSRNTPVATKARKPSVPPRSTSAMMRERNYVEASEFDAAVLPAIQPQRPTEDKTRGHSPPKSAAPAPSVPATKRKRADLLSADEPESNIPIPPPGKRQDTMGAKACGKAPVPPKAPRSKTMQPQSGLMSPSLQMSGAMSPRSFSGGNFFKGTTSTAPNPFRNGVISPREAIATPVAAAHDAAPIVAPRVDAPAVPKPSNRRGKIVQQENCFQCKTTTAPVNGWKRKAFADEETHRVCLECWNARDVPTPAAPAASLKPAFQTSRRSSADESAPNTTASSSHRSSVDITANNSIATSISAETRARSSSVTLGPVESRNGIASSAVQPAIEASSSSVEPPTQGSASAVEPPAEALVSTVIEAPVDPAPLTVDATVAPAPAPAPSAIEALAPAPPKKITLKFNVPKAPVPTPAPMAPVPVASKKASATAAQKAPKAKAPAKVKKEVVAAPTPAPGPAPDADDTAPKRRGGRSKANSDLVEMNLWAQRGDNAVKAAPKGKMISDVFVKGGKVVKIEKSGSASESELSVHDDGEFEEL